MQFSLGSLLLLILVASVYLAAWNEPSVLALISCAVIFALALMTAVVMTFTGRTESRWAACGFAATGIAAVCIFGWGKPVTWSDVLVERLVASQRDQNVMKLWKLQYQQTYFARRPSDSPSIPTQVIEQLRFKLLYVQVLFLVSCCGAAVTILCRRNFWTALGWLTVITLGATIFNGWCLLHSSAVWREAALAMTTFVLVTSLAAALVSRPPMRLAIAAFVVVGGTYFMWALRGTTEYFRPLPASSFMSQLYDLWVPPERRAAIGYILDGTSIIAISPGPSAGVFPWEFAEMVHCFIATSLGSLAAWTLLASHYCIAKKGA